MSDAPLEASDSTELDTVLFHEQQRYREPYTWVILVLVSALLIGTVAWMIMRQVVRGIPFGPEAMSDGALVSLGVTVVVINLFYVLRYALSTLQTEVTYRGLFVRYWPRQQKVRQIDLHGVKEIHVVRYHPYMEYGGRGLKRRRRSTAYTVGGNEGVRIDYHNGVHVLLGTQSPAQLAEAIQLAVPKTGGKEDPAQ